MNLKQISNKYHEVYTESVKVAMELGKTMQKQSMLLAEMHILEQQILELEKGDNNAIKSKET